MSRHILIEMALSEEESEAQRRRRQRQLNIDRELALTDGRYVQLYRLNGTLLEELFANIVPLLRAPRNSRGVDPITKILTALVFYARGSYQEDVSKEGPMSQQSVSRFLREVTDALNNPIIVAKYIRFPQNRAERSIIKRGFYEKFQIPGVCGCIDCTHIQIIKPAENEERFINRKQKHSLNVQMICDHEYKILNVDARYGGATHDAFIWQNCQIKDHFEALVGAGEEAILLGDSGYPLREYMMIPVDQAAPNSPEYEYNRRQKTARSIIERTFGVLKGRWRCLLSARELHYKPEVAGKITIACSVLHNMCIHGEMEPVELTEEELRFELERQPPHVPHNQSLTNAGLLAGRRVRDRIIAHLHR